MGLFVAVRWLLENQTTLILAAAGPAHGGDTDIEEELVTQPIHSSRESERERDEREGGEWVPAHVSGVDVHDEHVFGCVFDQTHVPAHEEGMGRV